MEIVGSDQVHVNVTKREIHFRADAYVIGSVVGDSRGLVTMTSKVWASRIMDMLSEEQTLRICQRYV